MKSGIRDIIEGLLDEGPVSGISVIENGDEMITTFLNRAQGMNLESADYEVIRDIRIHYEDEASKNPDIVFLCGKLLDSDGCMNGAG